MKRFTFQAIPPNPLLLVSLNERNSLGQTSVSLAVSSAWSLADACPFSAQINLSSPILSRRLSTMEDFLSGTPSL
ncbi:MAG: hypothetical protein VXW13_09590, partial [SAR324 cluster bacterium]|nr:hypothetical protein [SAR324 cluster bacterium]